MPGNLCRSTCCACMKAPLQGREQPKLSFYGSRGRAGGIYAVVVAHLYPQELQKLMCTLPPSLS